VGRPLTVAELRDRLASSSEPERLRLLGRILREARDTDVWRFTTPAEVAARWDALAPHLGRRRRFWAFLLAAWRAEGLLARDGSLTVPELRQYLADPCRRLARAAFP
jgi:hypothetical protein